MSYPARTSRDALGELIHRVLVTRAAVPEEDGVKHPDAASCAVSISEQQSSSAFKT